MAEMATDQPPVQVAVSEKFCADDAEITYKSEDSILFRIHKSNLEACTEGFSPPQGFMFDEIVELSEPASVLELLFQFIYPYPIPDLESIDFNLLDSLAEAAEKYQVYPAMPICQIHMLKSLPREALSVFAYATKHDYHNVMRDAAPLVLDIPLPEILEKIPREFVAPWAQYHSNWLRAHRNALTLHMSVPSRISKGRTFATLAQKLDTVKTLAKGLSSLLDLDSTFKNYNPSTSMQWRHAIQTEVNALPVFTSFLKAGSILEPQISAQFLLGDANPPVSEKFFDEGGDIKIKSSDGVLFSVHHRNLKACMQNLGVFNDKSGAIDVPEISSTLELLFNFAYPRRHPDIQFLDFDTVKSLAVAAEKYIVFPAMYMCNVYMKKTLPAHADWILGYAARGKYHDVMDVAAPLVIDRPLKDVVLHMPQEFVVPLIRYYDLWNQVAQAAVISNLNQMRVHGCHSCSPSASTPCVACGHGLTLMNAGRLKVLAKLGEGASSLKDVDATFRLMICEPGDVPMLPDSDDQCTIFEEMVGSWRKSVKEGIKNIPPFSSLMS